MAVKELTKVGGSSLPTCAGCDRQADRRRRAAGQRGSSTSRSPPVATPARHRQGAGPSSPKRRPTSRRRLRQGDRSTTRRRGSTRSRPSKDARFATFNASLNRVNAGDLAAELAAAGSAQPATIAEIIQRTRPEVLLINEFDYDAGRRRCAHGSRTTTCRCSQNGADPIEYPYPLHRAVEHRHLLRASTSTTAAASADFVPNDSFGFGFFPGQFGMVVYSMYPIDVDDIRTFQNFLWKDMPGALLPDDPATAGPADWYSPDELDVFRLSSKSHWDVPIRIGDRHGALPRQPPDATGVRRPRGPQRHPQLRRDPVLGRLRQRRQPRVHLRRRRRRTGGLPAATGS